MLQLLFNMNMTILTAFYTMIESIKKKKARTTVCRDPEEAAEAADLEADRAVADSVEAEEALAADHAVDSEVLPEVDFTAVHSLAADFLVHADIITAAVAAVSAACWAF